MLRAHGGAFLAALLVAVPVVASPALVKDLNRGPADPSAVDVPSSVTADGVTYFPAGDPAHGTELWRSDGTPDGTYRLTDVCAGRCSSSPSALQVFQGKVYFSADDGFSGRELWVSDGVPGHERRVKDLCTGPCDSSPTNLVMAGDRLLFLAQLGLRQQLWATDGSAAGTVRIATFCTLLPNADDCVTYRGLVSIGPRVLFDREDAELQLRLWVSDGTAAGTLPLSRLVPGLPASLSVPIPVPAAGFAYFWSTDALWRTDGTAAGTFRLAALADAGIDPFDRVDRMAVAGGLLYTSFLSGELVRSDGTPAGTRLIFKTANYEQGIDFLVPLPDRLLFVAEASDLSPSELWQTQGSTETTTKLADFQSTGFLSEIVPVGSGAIFTLVNEDQTEVLGLYTTDGTAAGTVPLTAAVPQIDQPSGLGAAGDRAFFLSRAAGAQVQQVLWETDGTAAGTHAVRDFGAGPGSAGPVEQVAFAGKLLFSAHTSPGAAPLFLSDGTPGGTVLLSDQALFATGFTRLGGRVYFGAADVASSFPSGSSPSTLWSTDGTAAGTRRVFFAYGFTAPKTLGQELLFTAIAPGRIFFGEVDLELWKSDGTPLGTTLVKQIDPFLDDASDESHSCYGEASSPGEGVQVGGRILFAARDGVHGRELWSTDGTKDGTRLVKDINRLPAPDGPSPCIDDPHDRPAGTAASDPDDFVPTAAGDLVLFAADDGAHGRELWRSNGISRGTRLVADLRPGPFGSSPHDLTRLGNTFYFFASISGPGEALVRSDGTAGGTAVVSDLALSGRPSWGRSLVISGDRLFFVVYNETTGAELWTSRGDAASTGLVADLNPGPGSSAPQQLADVGGVGGVGGIGGVLVFAADDGQTGLELWRSDGTAAGTRRLADLSLGRAASSPGPFTVAGDRLLFGADDGMHGRELWEIPLAEILAP